MDEIRKFLKLPPMEITGKSSIYPWLLALAATLGLACKGIFARLAFENGVSVNSLLFWRFALAAPALWLLSKAVCAKASFCDRRTLGGIALVGVFFALSAALDFAAVEKLGASVSRLLLFTYPVFLVALEAARSRSLPRVAVMGALMTCIGCLGVFLVAGSSASTAHLSVGSVSLSILAAMAYAAHFTLGAPLARQRGAVQLAADASISTLLIVAVGVGCATTGTPAGPLPLLDKTNAPVSIEVSSPDFPANGTIGKQHAFAGFGCTGQNIPPKIRWTQAPAGTQSFALIVHDPDAPTGVGFFHRVVVDLPADTSELGATLPAGARELHTDFGTAGYGGPCPPADQTHRYVFSVYALDVPTIGLPDGATGALTRFAILDHTLAVGRLVGTVDGGAVR